MPTATRFTGLRLSGEDRTALKEMLTGRTQMSARAWRRVRTLLLLDRGHSVTAAAEAVGSYRRETARVALADHGLKPWREKNVVRSRDRRGVHRPDGGRAGAVR